MEAPKFSPIVRVQKRLAELKKRQQQEDEFGGTLTETFERADDEVIPVRKEQE